MIIHFILIWAFSTNISKIRLCPLYMLGFKYRMISICTAYISICLCGTLYIVCCIILIWYCLILPIVNMISMILPIVRSEWINRNWCQHFKPWYWVLAFFYLGMTLNKSLWYFNYRFIGKYVPKFGQGHFIFVGGGQTKKL